tara:strand:+ start:14089 stop:27768 length:13680 start_codon:yes stop_codon:yes gene_type:complete
MAYNDDQNEYPLPQGNNVVRTSAELLPRYFRTNTNKKFLASTIDQLTTPGVIEKINSFVGSRVAKAVAIDDNYLADVTKDREDYQLETFAVKTDNIGNITFDKDYLDYIGILKSFRSNVDNHSLLNSQEFYAWNPHIDFDKFTNFREYYWLPDGPQEVPVRGQSTNIVSTYTVATVTDDDNVAYLFTPNGKTRNPNIKLYRGQTYKFEVDTIGHPISIAISRAFQPAVDADSSIITTLYEDGITLTHATDETLVTQTDFVGAGFIQKGVLEFTVPMNAPDTLYYISQYDINTSGSFQIYDIEDASEIDVEVEILDKKYYTTSSGWALSNGMKVYFQGNVTPASYAAGFYYVEGVGDKIKLVSSNDLEVPAIFTQDTKVPFDTEGFDRVPFSDALSFAGTTDYIVMNRKDRARNAWARYNRWFHKSIIEQSAVINNQPIEIDETARAKRPIIEFEENIRLYNHGTTRKENVDLVDTFTPDVFSTIEGSTGYNVDGIDLVDGMRVLFTADADSFVNGKIFIVKYITHNNRYQISLIETDDTTPILDETILIKQGNKYAGKMFWYNGTEWKLAQDKTGVNQAPLFNLYDTNGVSISDNNSYPASNFTGNRIFSYRVGTGANDSELGFPLSYKNISNVGDIVFDFNLLNNTYTYEYLNQVLTIKSDTLFLKKYNVEGFEYVNSWTKANVKSQQFVIRKFTGNDRTNSFPVDMFDYSAELTDLDIRVFLNNKLMISGRDYSFVNQNRVRFIVMNKDIEFADILVIKAHSKTPKNSVGYYEIPHNFERNPLNNNIVEFTLGQVNDHVESLVAEMPAYVGYQPGIGNLRDLGQVAMFGRKFVQHSGPLNLPLYHLTDNVSNIIKSLRFAKKEYSKFKRAFLQMSADTGFDGLTKQHVDHVLGELNKDKTARMPFYSSDMLAFGAAKVLTYTVLDYRTQYYALTTPFNINTVTNKAVNIYVNGTQLTYSRDYTFTDTGFVYITSTLENNNVIEIYEYENTEASFIPPTPTSFGLFPAYEPEIFLDTSYATPTTVIRGHDGSLTVAYNDYRDQLLLEFEKRIYNNIKVRYNASIFDLSEYVEGNFRNTNISKNDVDTIMITDFVDWLKLVGDADYTTNSIVSQGSSFTYNYSRSSSPTGNPLPGFWRAVYKQAYDTDRPHTHPWEMLGFSSKPSWWESVYGPAPYTSDNLILWQDLEQGAIKEPGKAVIRDKKYVRPGLTGHIPTNEFGQLLSPLESSYARGFSYVVSSRDLFEFGDEAPTETAWRRSSDYPYSLLTALLLLRPAQVMGINFDRSRIARDLAGNISYSASGKRLRLEDLVFPGTKQDTTYYITAGLINFVADYMKSNVTTNYSNYMTTLKGIKNKLGFKLGGFAEKEKLRLVLDSRTPLNKGNVFVPYENYDIILRSSNALDVVSYSGVIVEKTGNGYRITGYDKEDPYFLYNSVKVTNSDPTVNVGGISESFIEWNENNTLVAGKIIRYEQAYYRVNQNHVTSTSFDPQYYSRLSALPIVGGVGATFANNFETVVNRLNYGAVLTNAQAVVDFLLGYESYLKSLGFEFEYVNKDTEAVENFRLISKEFLFWTTQNWAVSSIITLSPAANQIKFKRAYHIVDNVFNSFYNYPILKADGTSFNTSFVNVYRDNANEFSLEPANTNDGIFFLKLPLIQKEHAIIIDNITVFNDTIYDPEPGYRQERIKVVGYRTDGWTGSLNIPGFIYDQAVVTEWKDWKDYAIGDLVKYKEFYYSARFKHTGKVSFDDTDWTLLSERPVSSLKANWDYKANQFADFYDLDTDNFDSEQQRLAQHLIGYQKRQYLENIIQDDVSQYKFYQGFIQDKGTNNALTKLFEKLGSANQDSLEFYEEWAIRTGQYGATDSFEEVEYQLNETQFRIEPQIVELVSSVNQSRTDLVYQYPVNKVYVKPEIYTHTPFPTTFTTDEVSKTGGYVKLSQINMISKTLTDVLSIDINTLDIGTYIWVPQYKQTWDVYKHILSPVRIELIEKTDLGFRATFNDNVPFTVGTIVGIAGLSDDVNGFWVARSISKNVIEFYTDTPIVSTSTDYSDSTLGIISVLDSRRFNNVSAINDKLKRYDIENADRIWVDNNGNNKFEVFDNNPVFSLKQEIVNPEGGLDGDYALIISVNDSNTIMAVGIPELGDNGGIYIYSRLSENNNYTLLQTISPDANQYDAGAGFGTSVSLTGDGQYLFVGAPLASNVKTYYKGEIDPLGSYSAGDIVSDRGTLWKAKVAVTGDNSTINTLNQDWDAVDVITVDADAVGSGLTNQGVLHIFKRQNNNSFREISANISPMPINNGKFGTAVKTAFTSSNLYRVYIRSAAGTGRLYFMESDVTTTDYFRYTRDRSYRGTFNELLNYVTNEIVYQFGNLYKATTNVFASSGVLPGDAGDNPWEQLSEYVDYVGFIPNFGDVLDEDSDSSGLGSASDIAKSFDMSKNGEVLIITGLLDTTEYRVSIYRKNNEGRYEYRQSLDPTIFEEAFGYSSAISDDGSYIAISAILNDSTGIDNGKVYVYKYNTSVPLGERTFELVQELYAPIGNKNELFGYQVDFSNNRLAVMSTDSIVESTMLLDNGTTIFDNKATAFVDTLEDTGQVYMFENINGVFVYAEKMLYTRSLKDARNPNIILSNNHLIVGAPGTAYSETKTGLIIDFMSARNSKAWTSNSVGIDFVDTSKMRGVFLYDRNTSDLISYVDYVDPIQGKIAGTADQEITFKLYYDPAVYNIGSTDTGTGSPWGNENLGKLWWDLSTVKWYNPYQGNTEYRSNNWNKVIPGFSVDVYEWVESDYLPSEWDDLTGTTEGASEGVSGTSKYSDLSYVRKEVYDSVSGTFSRKYYFWVRSPSIIPNTDNRKISCASVINLIQDPAGSGYRFVSLLGNDRFALHNVKGLIKDTDTIIHFEYDIIEIDDTNVHSEYQLLTEGVPSSKPNNDIVQKWIDSLAGYDKNSNPLPDTSISIARRYGVLNTPNQSMFVNRIEALKQVVDRVNDVLSSNLIVDDFNISSLSTKDTAPSTYSRQWDVTIESENLLRFVGVARITKATLLPTIVDGKITNVTITNPGRGYTDPAYTTASTERLGPTVTITGTGTGAKIQLYINNLGQVTSAVVLKQGRNYGSNTTITVRPFSVLVNSDSTAAGFWSLYSYDTTTKEWYRVSLQKYDTSLYWTYKDWYATGYDLTTAINYSVPGSYALAGLNDKIGSIVKIDTIGSGGWLLLKKIDNQAEVDYTVNYETIGRENGTIQLSNLLYNNTSSGFDNQVYDAALYDREPVDEIKNIMYSLRNDIFVDQLEVEWNKLFFASIRYTMAEQTNVDWVFKTSFVKAKHNVGEFDQRITYKNDNLENYQDYVNEVKPYSTKVREYVSAYERNEPTQTSVTDFDLPPRYDTVAKKIIGESIKVIDNVLVGTNQFTTTYPQKHWLDNLGFDITEFKVSDAGTGYTDSPVVTVSGGGGPTLIGYASLVGSSINSIEVDTVGAKYLSSPTISINGSQTEDGTIARASAIIGNSKIRSTHMLIKFDRTSGNYLFTVLSETETFTGNSGTTEFNLKFPLDTKRANVKVYVAGVQLLSSEYTVTNNLDLSKGYRRYLGQVIFTNAPATGKAIVVEYKKSAEMMSAVDRINWLYNPTTGMLGKDLGQLMDGIDYGGVQVDTISFNTNRGFDVANGLGFGAEPFDTYDTTYEDLIFVLDGSTQIIELGTTLEAGVVYNIYKNNVRLDDPSYDGSSVVINPNAVMVSITGDGITNTFYIDNDVIETRANDVIIIRKSTSDGSFTPDATSYDVSLDGGNLLYTNAKGINSGDIVVDGDGFVTETNSKGPEENVPGQIYDTLDLRVYNRVSDGQGIITVHNYITDGETVEWNISNLPQASTSTIVKLDNIILEKDNYEIDYANKKLVFTDSSLLVEGQKLSITLISSNGNDILDSDQFIADGDKIGFETYVTYNTEITAFIAVNGIVSSSVELVQSSSNTAELLFVTAPAAGSVITYTIYNGNTNQYSQLLIDNTFIADGINKVHTFDTLPYVSKPFSHNILAQVGNIILNPGRRELYTLTVDRAYDIASWQFADITEITQSDVLCYINGVQITKDDYSWDPVNGRIELLKNNVGLAGDTMEVIIIKDADYYFVDTVLKMSNVSQIEELQAGTEIQIKLADDSTVITATIKSSSRDTIIGDATKDERTVVLDGYVRELHNLMTTDNTPSIIINDGSSVSVYDSSNVVLDDVYTIESNNLTFAIAPTNAVKIHVFSNHDINQFDRTSYDVVFYTSYAPEGTQEYLDKNLLSRGYIKLRSTTLGSEYVWIIKNGTLLSANVDYKLTSTMDTIKLVERVRPGDTIDVIHFAAPVSSPKYGYRIFKDMLNRTHYKRLNKDNEYQLAQPLNYYDLSIVLADATGITEPNKNTGSPGIVFIQGERIEYYAKDGNLLRQLRRSTLGTGAKLQYPVGTVVAGQGPEETIPYKDETYTTVFVGDGSTNDFVLDFTPTSINEFEVFVAGRRLRNHTLASFDITIAQDSTDGDIILPKEFTLEDNILSLTDTPANNIKIQIVRKLGKTWNDLNKSISDSNNQIARFIKDKTISLAR